MSRRTKVAKKRATRAAAAPVVVAGVDVRPLHTAERLLRLVIAVGNAAELGPDGEELPDAIWAAHRLVDETFQKLAASRGAK